MTKEELKALGLTDDQVSKILDDQGKNFVTKTQINTKNEELKHAKAESGEITKQLEALKKANEGNKDLAAEIEKMKADAETRKKEYAASINQMKVDNAVAMALTAAKAKNSKAARALLDLSNAKLGEDGKVVGLDEQIKKLQESDAYLFDAAPAPSGVKPGESKDKEGPGEGGNSVASIFSNALG